MSGTTAPPLPSFPKMRTGDVRVFTGSFVALLGQATISSIVGVTITRVDGAVIGANDLAISGSPALDSTSRMVIATYIKGIAGVWYLVSFSVGTTNAQTLDRDVLVYVSSTLG